jgi:hypothetical protein
MTGHYSIESSRIQAIFDKAETLKQWLNENAPDCELSQKHLDPGTVEQVYWHYGYLCALKDVLTLVDAASTE